MFLSNLVLFSGSQCAPVEKTDYICGNRNGTCFMKIVIDEKIPYIKDALNSMGHSVVALPGAGITRDALAGAQALFVRTRTICNAARREGTAVRFIGTATIGYDHIDAAYCAAAGIEWHNAAGCNAGAVLQYVQSVVYSLLGDVRGLSIGVVGVGEIGSRVARWAAEAGMTVYRNDPPRAARGEAGFVSLAEIASECDIVTFHPTLQKGGAFPSYHLADEAFFSSLKRCRLIINASRGPVVDNEALLRALERNGRLQAVLDVWEGEPEINIPLLNKVDIATPHIAGYSAEGKMNATRMVLEAFAHFSGYSVPLPELSLPQPRNAFVKAGTLKDALLSVYSPLADSRALKSAPERFEQLRNEYVLRREPASFNIELAPENV